MNGGERSEMRDEKGENRKSPIVFRRSGAGFGETHLVAGILIALQDGWIFPVVLIGLLPGWG